MKSYMQVTNGRQNTLTVKTKTGRVGGGVSVRWWIAHWSGSPKVAGSNPTAFTFFRSQILMQMPAESKHQSSDFAQNVFAVSIIASKKLFMAE
jgi:hypothetical protein